MWIKFHTLCWCLLLIFGCTCANMDEQACVLYAWNICFIMFLGFNTLKAFCHMPLTRWNKGQFCWTSWKNTVKVRIVCSAFLFPLLIFVYYGIQLVTRYIKFLLCPTFSVYVMFSIIYQKQEIILLSKYCCFLIEYGCTKSMGGNSEKSY